METQIEANGMSKAYGGKYDGKTWPNAPAVAYQFIGGHKDTYVWDRTYDDEGYRVYRPEAEVDRGSEESD